MAEESDKWNCPACTLLNELTATCCEACGTTSPLVLDTYQLEANAIADDLAAAVALRHDDEEATQSTRGRGSSQESMDDDIAADLDPWAQAEREWAHVEAHQEANVRKRK